MSSSVIAYAAAMGRWEPGADSRLRVAAMELYAERGYEQATVAEIAERAGVTARTFFRHFADKREVLFSGSAELQERLLAALEEAPAAAAPIEAVAAALDEAAEMLGGNRDWSIQRQQLIDAHADLRERELIKMADLAAAFADALVRRGGAEPSARLVGETGVAVFRVAFERWLGPEGESQGLATLMRASLVELAMSCQPVSGLT
jgi:AcrR family transcriptional regulator